MAGLPTRKAFDMGIGFLGVGFMGTCLSWVLLVYFGRRNIYNVGLGLLCILQILIGILEFLLRFDDRACVLCHLMRVLGDTSQRQDHRIGNSSSGSCGYCHDRCYTLYDQSGSGQSQR